MREFAYAGGELVIHAVLHARNPRPLIFLNAFLKILMRRTAYFILQVFLILALPQAALAETEWELIKDSEWVVVYARELEGYSERQFKGICSIPQPIEIVAAVLADISSYPQWFYSFTEAKKLPNSNSTVYDFFMYIVIDVPWPFSDRDAVFHAQTTLDPVSEKILIASTAQIDPIVPVREDYVRITDSEQQWILEKLSPETTRVTFINRTNAAGSMSAFFSDFGSQVTINQSLKNMRKIVSHTKYKKLASELKKQFKSEFQSTIRDK